MIRNKELYLIRPRTIISKTRDGDYYNYKFDVANQFFIARKKHHTHCTSHKAFDETYFLLNSDIEVFPNTSAFYSEVGDVIIGQIVPISLYINKKFVTKKYLDKIANIYNEKFKEKE